MKKGGHVCFVALVSSLLFSVPTMGMAQEVPPLTPSHSAHVKDQLLYDTLRDWDSSGRKDKENLKRLLPLYGVDPIFLTSQHERDNAVEDHVLRIMRMYKQWYLDGDEAFSHSMASAQQKLFAYIGAGALSVNLSAFFQDIEHALAKHPRLSLAVASREQVQQALKVDEEKRQQRELAKRKVEEERRAASLEAAQKRQRVLDTKSKKASQMGFTLGVCEGVSEMIQGLTEGHTTVSSASKCLIEPSDADLRFFRVGSLVDKYVIYSHERRQQLFALQKERGEFYGNNAPLRGDFFRIVGTQQFKTVLGSMSELIVLRKVDAKLE